MTQKQPPHLVMAKQPTITNKDPFQTSKEEAKCIALFEGALNAWIKKVKARVETMVPGRELAPPKKVLDIGIAELETDDLKAEAWDYVEKGYLKGIQFTSNQLSQLNIDISINLGNQLSKQTLAKIKDLFEESIDEWASDLQKKVYDLIYSGLENESTLKQIIDQIDHETKIGLSEAHILAADAIIYAARKSEMDLFQEAGIEIYLWIAVVDLRTCETCIALAGRMYHDDPAGRGLVNHDSGEFLRTELEDLTPSEDFINPGEGQDGPPIHNFCRCHLQPVITIEQYKGTVNKIVSEV
jgi:SPP1 gp7 family putative phage head morphogenesis protein